MSQLVAVAFSTFGKFIVTKGAAFLGISQTAATILGGAIQIGSLFINRQTKAVSASSQTDVRRELTAATSQPAKRFVYGNTVAQGTPVFWRSKGKFLYVCYLLNSRKSSGNFNITVDERAVSFTGDPYDFSSAGGNIDGGTANPILTGYMQVWFGLGSQTQPPAEILTDLPTYLTAADAWKGQTVMWVKVNAGANSEIGDRWPSAPPAIKVYGDWSLVLNPATNADEFTENQSLIALDMLRNNPIRSYHDREIDFSSFQYGAAVADQSVALNNGGSEPRYRCSGTIKFTSSEIHQLVQPVLDAGASHLTRVNGLVTFVPGEAKTPVTTISDAIGSSLTIDTWSKARDIPNTFLTSFTSRDRNYERVEIGAYSPPNSLTEDGNLRNVKNLSLDLVTSATQAMRVTKIRAYEIRSQVTIKGEFPPDAFKAFPGAAVSVALDGLSPFDGTYLVTQFEPQFRSSGDGVALSVNMQMQTYDAAGFSWVPATDEQAFVTTAIDNNSASVDAPNGLAVTPSVNGQQVTFTAVWDESTTAGAGYSLEMRINNGSYVEVVRVENPVASGGNITAVFSGGTVGVDHDFRVRAFSGVAYSAYTNRDNIIP